MDAEKMTEVEMKELTPTEVQDEDAEKGKIEETKGKNVSFISPYIFISFYLFLLLSILIYGFVLLMKETI